MDRIKSLLTMRFGKEIRTHSMIHHEEFMTKFLQLAKPQSIAEIGTLHGVSAALFASLGLKVATFDIVKSPLAEEIWRYLEVDAGIAYFVCQNDQEKKEILLSRSFDIAFIDGDHQLEKARFDFECVKRCGFVVFHDYKPSSPHFKPLADFIDSLTPSRFTFGEPESLFAVWIAEGNKQWDNFELVEWLKASTQKTGSRS